MTSTKNIFELLDVGQDSDDDQPQKGKNAKTSQKTVQKDEAPKRAPIDAKGDELQKEQRKKNDKKTTPKEKGVSEDPHPKDRQSGMKYDGAMQKNKFRKGGAGNVGTLKDELTRSDQIEPVEGVENQSEEVTAETEQKPKYKTVQEYYQSMGIQEQEETQEQRRARLSEKDIADQLKKEKLEYVKTKEEIRQQEAANNKPTNKAKATRVDYKAAFQSEKAELLGFKTGLVEVLDTDKPKREERRDDRRQERKPEGEGNQQEGEKAVEQDQQGGRRDNGNRGGNRRGQQGGQDNRRDNNRQGGDKRRTGGKGGSKGFNTNTEEFPTLG